MEIIEKDGHIFMKVVYKSPLEKEGKKKWLFKELNMKDFIDIDIDEKLIEGKTKIGQSTIPLMFMINLMMIEGDKVTEQTPYRIFAFLKDELNDFLA